ncbi:endoglucanase G-like [Pecten maximus]|uniref:endoglucanase G-like n=1 Tax=Pecten maximus TaxID=6579 RepID=UPI001458E318|nr:endoglucanase G-like [Pecten maximus]
MATAQFLVLLVSLLVAGNESLEVPMTGVNDWGGRFEGKFVFTVPEEVAGWEAILHFDEPVTGMTEWMGDIIKTANDNTEYILVSKPHTGIQHVGQTLTITVQAAYSGSAPPTGKGTLVNMAHDGQTVPPAPTVPGSKYNYAEVLEKSILFYEAQRSGKLPTTNRIPWRGDSALSDHGLNGEDLTGGWYDAGDHVKFGLPMSASVTILAWGFLQYADAYEAAGQTEYMYDCIRWPLEWLVKAHTAPNELYIQVGDGGQDHGFWGRPEDMKMVRPAFKVDATKPGSDVAGEYAAAMAAGYLVFKDKDPTFAAQLLSNAEEIYKFAVTYKGIYSNSVNEAAAYYRSSAYEDELCWGALWLYMATNKSSYLTDAKTYYPSEAGPDWGQSWDDKGAGCQILMYNITGEQKYKDNIEATFTAWLPGGSLPYSPKGLAFRSQWGSLRYASNMAFMALLAADNGIRTNEYRAWAKSQIHYALGDTGRSFVVGFGVNPPTQPHHRGSSCPMMPTPCSWEAQQHKGPNPHTLYGALVGGPDGSDSYTDSRGNYINNEVACDYNAGFQSAVAGLMHLTMADELP